MIDGVSAYRVPERVPLKSVKSGWSLLILMMENAVGGLGRSRDQSLSHSSGFKDNLEGIHSVIWPVCVILKKTSGRFLSLSLAYM